MHFVCQYSGGKKYGTENPTNEYRATVKSTSAIVTVNYTTGGNALDGEEAANSAKRDVSIDLQLTKAEAMQLAAAILAQANHPNYHNLPVTWVPATFMPKLEKSKWEENLTLSTDSRSSVQLQNNSAFHIGTINVEIHVRILVKSTPVNTSFRLHKTIDLLPKQSVSISISNKDIPREYRTDDPSLTFDITKAEILEATGIDVSQA